MRRLCPGASRSASRIRRREPANRLTPKNIARGLDILRHMKSLKTIGIEPDRSLPAAEFWQRYDKREFK
jgi:hypothetical protein